VTGTALGTAWTDPAALGYPAVFGGVLLGSVVPVVPTGAVVSAAAALAVTGGLSLPLVLVLSVLGALLGDLVTFGAAKLGSATTLRWVARGQSPERLAAVRDRFAGRDCCSSWSGGSSPPAGSRSCSPRAPWTTPGAGSSGSPAGLHAVGDRLRPAGIVSGGLFDDPLVATLVATALVLVVAAVGALVQRLRRRS
jgi:hypothetical protein